MLLESQSLSLLILQGCQSTPRQSFDWLGISKHACEDGKEDSAIVKVKVRASPCGKETTESHEDWVLKIVRQGRLLVVGY